jgi:dipeptidyl aminopeptidase/acylaminoacyl peptidase
MQRLRRFVLIATLTAVPFLAPRPGLAQKRAITFADFLALPNVGGPQLSPDGKSIAYTVTTYSLPDNRGTSRVWLADVATGQTRQLTQGAGSDRQPRWSPDGGSLAFVSTRQAAPGCGSWRSRAARRAR